MSELAYVYANCQANVLHQGLNLQPEFASRFELRALRNFKKFDDETARGKAPIQQFREDASRVKLFIYQAEAWDKNAAVILDVLAPECVKVPIHSIATTIFWPYYMKDMEIRTVAPKDANADADAFWAGDSFIVGAAKQGVPADQIVQRYMALDINSEAPLDRWLSMNLASMRKKEQTSVFRLADLVEERFRNERTFYTNNHPNNRLLRKAVDDLLAALGLPRLDPAVGDRWETADRFAALDHHPIHPGIIDHYGLTFVTPQTRYLHGSSWYTFEEWVRCYAEMASRLYGQERSSAA